MITENNKRLEFENLQDAMKTAKTLLKNGYQVYMNIEDDLGDGKIIVVIEYEWLDEELADGHYIYQTFEDEARIEAEIRQKRNKETNEDYIWGHEEGYQEGWSKGYDEGYQKRMSEEDCEADGSYDEGYQDGYSNGYEDGYDEGYETGLNEGDIDCCRNDE